MHAPIAIRVSTDDDERQLAELDATSWPLELQVSPPQPAEAPFFSDRRVPGDVLVATDPEAILGYVRVGRHMTLPDNDHVLHLDALVVAPAARGRGVGGALIEAAISEARRRGVVKLGLRALSTNPGALRLYQRYGFVEEGRLRAEFRRPDGSFADDVWLALWLTAEPAEVG